MRANAFIPWRKLLDARLTLVVRGLDRKTGITRA
jgi:hypothetical protein